MRRRRRPEQAIQHAIFEHIRARGAPGLFAFHVPNGGYRTPIEAAMLKGQGVVAGVPDIILIRDGMVFGLEVKAPGGRVTQKQLDVQMKMDAAGAYTGIAEGLNEALAMLEAWGCLVGKTQ